MDLSREQSITAELALLRAAIKDVAVFDASITEVGDRLNYIERRLDRHDGIISGLEIPERDWEMMQQALANSRQLIETLKQRSALLQQAEGLSLRVKALEDTNSRLWNVVLYTIAAGVFFALYLLRNV